TRAGGACAVSWGTTDLTVLSGDDSLTLPMMSVGAEGVISVVGNLVPGPMIELVQAAAAGDYETARKLHHRLFALCSNMLGIATNPIPIKAAMQMVGRDSGELRLPMTPLEDSQAKQLRETLFAFGLEAASLV
ncbi:MAG: dihydrodipicolinate synthase family protein, partial [Planctomycetes bacterium]|nr:dihydrodipicolinate synthase family protein [Planctomycetota bacterium]